jgi:hypothetical protein
MFHDLEVKGRNWHKELPSVLWALRTKVNRATRDTPFHLVYGSNMTQYCHLKYISNQLGWHSSMKPIKMKQHSLMKISWSKTKIKH